MHCPVVTGFFFTQNHPKMTPPIPFTFIDWSQIAPSTFSGETGQSTSRTLQLPGLRLRRVDYSPGYLADHWCQLGHVVHCLEGSFVTEMEAGESFTLTAGMTYVVSDGMSSHRSFSREGVSLLIVDGEFLGV
jgi:hypothetical protein